MPRPRNTYSKQGQKIKKNIPGHGEADVTNPARELHKLQQAIEHANNMVAQYGEDKTLLQAEYDELNNLLN